MTRISHSSTNSFINPYAKDFFQGTPEVQEALKNVKRNLKCKPLMSPEAWASFCFTRRFLDL